MITVINRPVNYFPNTVKRKTFQFVCLGAIEIIRYKSWAEDSKRISKSVFTLVGREGRGKYIFSFRL